MDPATAAGDTAEQLQELQRFGRSFLGHCRRKRMVLPKDGAKGLTCGEAAGEGIQGPFKSPEAGCHSSFQPAIHFDNCWLVGWFHMELAMGPLCIHEVGIRG